MEELILSWEVGVFEFVQVGQLKELLMPMMQTDYRLLEGVMNFQRI
jgi:hypothetical protein